MSPVKLSLIMLTPNVGITFSSEQSLIADSVTPLMPHNHPAQGVDCWENAIDIAINCKSS